MNYRTYTYPDGHTEFVPMTDEEAREQLLAMKEAGELALTEDGMIECEMLDPETADRLDADFAAFVAAQAAAQIEAQDAEPEPEHPTQEQRHLWANARTAHALLSGSPYVYLEDDPEGDEVYYDLILINWKGQEVVCPVPVVINMLHPEPHMFYSDPEQNIVTLIGYRPDEYRLRQDWDEAAELRFKAAHAAAYAATAAYAADGDTLLQHVIAQAAGNMCMQVGVSVSEVAADLRSHLIAEGLTNEDLREIAAAAVAAVNV